MDAITLNDLMSLREDIDMEFKAAQGRNGKGKVPKSFWDTYSAMANTDGGRILFGVKEKKKGEIIVFGVEDTERVKKELWDNLNNPQKASVNLLSNNDVKIFEIQGRKILQITVPRAGRKKRPVYVGGGILLEVHIAEITKVIIYVTRKRSAACWLSRWMSPATLPCWKVLI